MLWLQRIELHLMTLLAKASGKSLARIRGLRIPSSARVVGAPTVHIHRGSRITIGERVVLSSRSANNTIGISRAISLRTGEPGAEIVIGADSGLSGTAIYAAKSVVLGERVLVGTDCIITDSDHHPIDEIPRHDSPPPQARPADRVLIHDDVFIGARSIVLKGVEIGRGSVVAAGSTVTRDVPPMTLVAGNPARPVRSIELGNT